MNVNNYIIDVELVALINKTCAEYKTNVQTLRKRARVRGKEIRAIKEICVILYAFGYNESIIADFLHKDRSTIRHHLRSFGQPKPEIRLARPDCAFCNCQE